MTTSHSMTLCASSAFPRFTSFWSFAGRFVKAIAMCLPSVAWSTPAFAWARSENDLAKIVSRLDERGYRTVGRPVWCYVQEVNDVVWKIGVRPPTIAPDRARICPPSLCGVLPNAA